MNQFADGNAIVYCPGAFGTTNGKTAHGLVRRSRRYRILSVVDPRHAGSDAGDVLDGKPAGIPVLPNLEAALAAAREQGTPATRLVVGLTPDGGRLPASARADILTAIRSGLNVDCGLHDLLNEDAEFSAAARQTGVELRDIRRPLPRAALHFFSGKIEQVDSLKVAILGTDSAVGKRTTAWLITDALCQAGHPAELVGTGQTAWMQGARYGVMMDALINDFLTGEIEHAVWSAWHEQHPEVLIIEGQGSLLNPAYPGGYEILAAARPDLVVLQHAPARTTYDGFPAYRMHPIPHQIQAIELISGKPVVAITINHEDLSATDIPRVCREVQAETGLPTFDVLIGGAAPLSEILAGHIKTAKS